MGNAESSCESGLAATKGGCILARGHEGPCIPRTPHPHPPCERYDPDNHPEGFVIHGIKAHGHSDGLKYHAFATQEEALAKQHEMLTAHPDTVVGITEHGAHGREIRRVELHELEVSNESGD
jgi:hypothetical protein